MGVAAVGISEALTVLLSRSSLICRRIRKRNHAIMASATTAITTPTAIPAFAPEERTLDFPESGAAGLVLEDATTVELDVLNAVLAGVADVWAEDVVV
jgi:hypothetical protein